MIEAEARTAIADLMADSCHFIDDDRLEEWLVFFVAEMKERPSDAETYALRESALDMGDPSDWYELAAWSAERGGFQAPRRNVDKMKEKRKRKEQRNARKKARKRR